MHGQKEVEIRIFYPSLHPIRHINVLLATTDFHWIRGTLFMTAGPRLEITYSAFKKNPRFRPGSFSDAKFYRVVSGKPQSIGSYRSYQVELLDPDAQDARNVRIAGKPLEEWLEILELEGSDEKEQAVKVLRESAVKVVPILIRILEDKDVGTRRKEDDDGTVEFDRYGFVKIPEELRGRAIKALPKIGLAAEAAIPVLIRSFEDDDLSVRIAAEEAISNFGAQSAVPLIEALASPHEQMRETVSTILSHLDLSSVPEAGPALLKLCDNANAEIRRAALQSMSEIGGDAIDAAVPSVIRRLTDTDHEVRSAAASVLGNAVSLAPLVVPHLAKVLRDENLSCRASAAEALGKMGEKAQESLPNLLAALQDEDGFVRVRAASAVWKIRRQKDEVMPVLKAALQEKEHSVRWNAAVEMGEIEPGNQDAIEALIRMLSDDPAFIDVTAMALGNMGSHAKAALPALRETLEKRSTGRDRVLNAIKQIESK